MSEIPDNIETQLKKSEESLDKAEESLDKVEESLDKVEESLDEISETIISTKDALINDILEKVEKETAKTLEKEAAKSLEKEATKSLEKEAIKDNYFTQHINKIISENKDYIYNNPMFKDGEYFNTMAEDVFNKFKKNDILFSLFLILIAIVYFKINTLSNRVIFLDNIVNNHSVILKNHHESLHVLLKMNLEKLYAVHYNENITIPNYILVN